MILRDPDDDSFWMLVADDFQPHSSSTWWVMLPLTDAPSSAGAALCDTYVGDVRNLDDV